MKSQKKSDNKCVKSAIVTGVLLILSGALLILTWPRFCDQILFKVSVAKRKEFCEKKVV